MMRTIQASVGLVVGLLLLGGAKVTYYEEALPETLNPLFATSMVEHRTHELMFDRLFYVSPIQNKVKSHIVQAYELLDNNSTLNVWLKEDLKWQDGVALTAADVCFTVDVLLNPKNASTIAKPYVEAIKKCSVDTKENKATITFHRSYFELRKRVAFHVLPKHKFKGTRVGQSDGFSARPTGSGPLKGTKGPRAATLIAKGASPHHNPNITEVTIQPSGDAAIAKNTILSNGVQGIVSVPPQYRAEIEASDELSLKSYDLRSWWFIALNTNRGALKNVLVRRALNLTLDRWNLRQYTVGYEKGEPDPACEFVSGPFVNVSSYYNNDVPTFERSDRGRAAELMKQAGAIQQNGKWIFDDKVVNLRIGMNAALASEAADLISQVGNQLQEGGFDRTVEKISTDDWKRLVLSGQTGEYDLLIGDWSFGLNEDVSDIFHTRNNQKSKGSRNIFNYSNSQVDGLLADYATAETDTQAKDAYHSLHSLLSEDLPYLFLWRLDTKSAWRNDVRDSTITPYYYFTTFDRWNYRK
jgi:peptide/nickel transport system substrate-binding protein